jgi:hypothetical protein
MCFVDSLLCTDGKNANIVLNPILGGRRAEGSSEDENLILVGSERSSRLTHEFVSQLSVPPQSWIDDSFDEI